MDDIVIVWQDLPDSRLSALTYPRLRPLVTNPAPQDVRALVAWSGDQPVGLLLLDSTHMAGSWRLLSVAVARPWRRRGIGLALMREAEAWLRQHGQNEVSTHHSDQMRGLEAWLGLLRRADWPPPRWIFTRLFGPVTWASEAKVEWRGMLSRLVASGFSVSGWEENSAADRAVIDQLAAQVPVGFDPRHAEPALSGPSITIREHGQPVGWILANPVPASDTVFYPIGYVVPRLQRGGWLLGGLVEACLRQAHLFGPHGRCCYQTAADNAAMEAVMRRRLAKWTVRLDREFDTSKSLAG